MIISLGGLCRFPWHLSHAEAPSVLMIGPPEPSGAELICSRGFAFSLIVFAALWLVLFVSMAFDMVDFGVAVLLFFASAIAMLAAGLMNHQSTKLKQNRRDAYARLVFNAARSGEIQRFAVFLRPFYLTGKVVETESSLDGDSKSRYELEHTIVEALTEVMPIIALGRPGEAIGVGRILTDETDWKTAAAELMLDASLIICIPSAHPGSAWEFEQLIRNGYLRKTVFLMPRALESFSSLQEQRRDWDLVAEQMGHYGIMVPHYREISPKNRTAVSYGLANFGLILHDLRAGQLRVFQEMEAAALLFAVNPEGGLTQECVDLRYPDTFRDAIQQLTSSVSLA